MRLIKPNYEILFISPNPLEMIELAGRTCYKSEAKINKDSAEKFVKMIMKLGHLSVIEHPYMTVRFICDRGITHEIVRHRLASYSQESTRWCSYDKEVTCIIPHWLDLEEGIWGNIGNVILPLTPGTNYTETFAKYGDNKLGVQTWLQSMQRTGKDYQELLSIGWSPERARHVLPTGLKTEIVMTCNFREWMQVVFKLRTAKRAHSQMREIMIPLLKEVKTLVPVIFDSIGE